ncbi:mCG7615, isoform CRA_a [Mus musculus]|nr:mCG7615, isoform CRA_a [Mus musculus]
MDDFLSISLLSVAMLVGCYVAGIIPLAVNFSETGFLWVALAVPKSLCGPGWPQIHRSSPVSAFLELGLKVCTFVLL